MADELRKIRTTNETEAAFETNGSAGLRCVASDTGDWLYFSQDGTKVYKAARQSYKSSGVTTYLDNDFNDVTVRGDLLVSEYIKLFGDTNNSIRFQSDQVDILAGGITGISNRDDEIQINPNGVSGFDFLIYTDSGDTDAKLIIEQNGAGDATFEQRINGGTSFFLGPDNDDSDTYKIGTTEGFGSNVLLELDTSGNLTVAGGISFSGGITCDWIDTGQGQVECYAMNQDVETTDNVQFAKVGVGISPAAAPLHVYENNSVADILLENPTSGQALYYSKSSLGEWVTGTGTAGNYVVYDVTNARFVLFTDTSGKTGIRTASPNNELTVNGDCDITGKLGINDTTPNDELSVGGSINQEERDFYFIKKTGLVAPSTTTNYDFDFSLVSTGFRLKIEYISRDQGSPAVTRAGELIFVDEIIGTTLRGGTTHTIYDDATGSEYTFAIAAEGVVSKRVRVSMTTDASTWFNGSIKINILTHQGTVSEV